jgi:hypothetical protein
MLNLGGDLSKLLRPRITDVTVSKQESVDNCSRNRMRPLSREDIYNVR